MHRHQRGEGAVSGHVIGDHPSRCLQVLEVDRLPRDIAEVGVTFVGAPRLLPVVLGPAAEAEVPPLVPQTLGHRPRDPDVARHAGDDGASGAHRSRLVGARETGSARLESGGRWSS